MKRFEGETEMVFMDESLVCFLWSFAKLDVNYETFHATVYGSWQEIASEYTEVAPNVSLAPILIKAPIQITPVATVSVINQSKVSKLL